MSSGRSHPGWARGVAVATAILFAALPVTAGAGSVTEPAPAPAASLSVTTNPDGATVYVDGKARGATPVEIAVAPGEHRVRIEKDGYLENSRQVSVAAGEASPLRVALTPSPYQVEEPPRPQPTPKPSGGGKGKKIAIIGLGAAAVGVGVFILATKNSPPVPGTISVSPTGTGMAGVTSFTISSQGSSDPDKDPLTYNWNFGDGASGSGQSTSHVFANTGSFGVTLAVSDGKHTVNAPGASVTVARSMAGLWSGATEPGFGSQVSVNLTQSGANLGGTMTFAGGLVGTLGGLTGTTGTTHPASVTFSTPSFNVSGFPGTFQVRFAGTTDSGGNTMSGTITITGTAVSPPSLSQSTTFRR